MGTAHGGLGGIFNNNWIAEKWDAHFLTTCSQSIEFLELFSLTAGVLTWSHKLTNTRLIIFCDNTAVKNMVNSMATSCVQCRKLIRLLALDGIRMNCRIFVRYVRSKFNVLADSLSRGKWAQFWRKAPKTMNRYPDELPKEIWPVEELWNRQCI